MKSIQQKTVAGTKSDEIDLIAGTSLWHDAWKRLRKNNMALSSGVIMVCLGVACLCGPALLGIMWGYDAHTQNLAYGPQPPSLQHPFGTDFYGRDLLVRVLTGARVSLSVGVLAALVAASIGTIYGAVSSYNGGLVDSFMMRIVDILYALPYMFLVIILVTILGKSLLLLFLALGAVGWLLTARVVRGVPVPLHSSVATVARPVSASPAGRATSSKLTDECSSNAFVYSACVTAP